VTEYTIVTHDRPVLGVDDVVRVPLDASWEPVRYEDLAVIHLDDGRTVVSCVPLLVHDVHLGDVIEVSRDASTGRLGFVRRVDRGQMWVFRVVAKDEESFRAAHELIHEYHGAVETWRSITGVAIRGDDAAAEFSGRLQELEDAGRLDYDTAER